MFNISNRNLNVVLPIIQPVEINDIIAESYFTSYQKKRTISLIQLKEEEATNLSFGTVIQISDSINLTVDWYSIDIDDRIVLSNSLGNGLSAALDTPAKLTAEITKADINDTIFFIIFSLLNIMFNRLCSHLLNL